MRLDRLTELWCDWCYHILSVSIHDTIQLHGREREPPGDLAFISNRCVVAVE